MQALLLILLQVISYGLVFYKLALLGYAVMSWLYLFGVLNRDQKFAATLLNFLHGIIEPVLSPLRNYIPSPGGLDLSFMALFFCVAITSRIVDNLIQKLAYQATLLT